MKLFNLTAFVLTAAIVPAGTALAEEWIDFSRSARTIYLVDLANISKEGDMSSVRVARVPTQATTSELSHSIEEYEIRCAENRSRIISETAFGPDGSEQERYPSVEAEFEEFRPTSLSGYLHLIVCGGERPSGTPAASLRDFIARGLQ